ncbi:cysteine proteinase [Xylariaceae sp. FL0255]|nr:cysteine proteinase [Xylariaceae sp. FL0255]
MVSANAPSQSPAGNSTVSAIDPYVLLEALTGKKVNRTLLPVRPANEEYDCLSDAKDDDDDENSSSDDDDDDDDDDNGGDRDRDRGRREPRPDSRPKDVAVGAINPFALVENMIGHRIERNSMAAIRILEDTLQTDYEELFDLRHRSVLFAGLKLNKKDRMAEELKENEVKILRERDLITPDVSHMDQLRDLKEIGFKEMGQARIKRAMIQNGKLHLILHADGVARTVCNREVTQTLNDICLPFRRNDEQRRNFTPPNSSWRDATEIFVRGFNRQAISDYDTFFEYGEMDSYGHRILGFNGNSRSREMRRMRRFDDPVQGATANSWFIAALFSVFWADPAAINRNTNIRRQLAEHMRIEDESDSGNDNDRDEDRRRRRFKVKFHDKGGRNNNKTMMVQVNYQIPVNNSSEDVVYCRSSNGMAIWPSLYEKAFTKWITGAQQERRRRRRNGYDEPNDEDDEHVDITQTHHGDPVKAMAQVNGREPEYWQCHRHEAQDLVGIVRANSVNHRTIAPMVCWTYATRREGRNEDRDEDRNRDRSNSRNRRRRHRGDRRDGDDDNKDDRQACSSKDGREDSNFTDGRDVYRGSNLVANHAYSILGWSSVGQGDKQYIVVRNPWGVTEPHGLTSYPGILTHVEPEYWRPANLVDQEGVMAIEAHAFREYFAYIGIAR